MSRPPASDAYRPVAAPWAAGGALRAAGAAAAAPGVRAPPVAPGAWAGRAAAQHARAAGAAAAAPARSSDAAEAAAPPPADAAAFERLALAAAAPPGDAGAPSVAARCAALRALRAGAAASPGLAAEPPLSGACCTAVFDALLLPWAAAAEAEADAAAGAPPRGDAPSPSELRGWLEAAERCGGALTRCAAFAPSELPQRFPAALFARLRSARTRPEDAPHLRALLHWRVRTPTQSSCKHSALTTLLFVPPNRAYRAQPASRRALRRHLGALLAAAGAPGAAWPPPPGVEAALDALACIAAGLRAPLAAHHRALLTDALLPLYTCARADACLCRCAIRYTR
jgi:hypothetical protein